MKIRIINLLLSFSFVFLITSEYVANVFVEENVPSTKIENIVEEAEERVDEKTVDKILFIEFSFFLHQKLKAKEFFCFIENLHTPQIPKPLLKPPISLSI